MMKGRRATAVGLATRGARWLSGSGVALLGLAGAGEDLRSWWGFLGTGQARLLALVAGLAMIFWSVRDVAKRNRGRVGVDERPPHDRPRARTSSEEESPLSQLLASHAAVDSTLLEVLREAGVEAPPLNTAGLAHLAFTEGLISAKTREAAEGLGMMHLLETIDDGRNLDPRTATKFVTFAEVTQFAIRQDWSNRRAR